MTYLPSLLNKIDNFIKLAQSPDDEEVQDVPYFDELMGASYQVSDPELSLQLQTLAELYRYAIKMGGGYATIARVIDNVKNVYSDEDVSDIEFTLNGMVKELVKHAGGRLPTSDNPKFVERLAQLKNDIESKFQPDVIDSYNEEVGPQGDLAEELGMNPEDLEIVNPAALGFDNKDDPKTNKGWHTEGSGKPYKNWREFYANERSAYEADLVKATDKPVQAGLTRLIELIPKLSKMTEDALNLKNSLGTLEDAPRIAAQKQLDALKSQLQELKKERYSLRRGIRNYELKKEQYQLESELSSTTDEKKSKLLEQQIALNKLTQSTDLRKGKERNYRQALIRAMSGGNYPSPQTLQDFEDKIQAANSIRITKADYDRGQSVERAKEHGKVGPVPVRQKGRVGGGRSGEKIHQYDLNSATFNGLIDKFNEKINTSAHVARLNVTQISVKPKVHNELKPFVERISKAIQKKDSTAKLLAIKDLKNQMQAWAERTPAIKALARNIKWLPFFQRMKTDLTTISSWQNETGWNLDEPKTDFIRNVINGGDQIIAAYRKYYPVSGPKRVNQLEISFDSTVDYLDALLDQLVKRTGITT